MRANVDMKITSTTTHNTPRMLSVVRTSLLVDGDKTIFEYLVSNAQGFQVKFISYGATMTSVMAPDRHGNLEEVTLCYPTLSDLKTKTGPYFGCVAGRVANRIKNGQFTLDGVEYSLPVNNGPNSLHGGIEGFDKKVWQSSAFIEDNRAGVNFEYTSPDGEEGYPGCLMVKVTYSLTSSNEIIVDYEATTDKATPINLTNHTYWNLSGNCKRKILEHDLSLSCDLVLPVTDTQIPTGAYQSVAGTHFDFTIAKSPTGVRLGEAIPHIDGCGRAGLDHCFVINGALDPAEGVASGGPSKGTAEGSGDPVLRHVGTLSDPVSGRELVVHTSQPGVQVYSANWLSLDEAEHPFVQHNAICLETQHFPDAVNQAAFPSAVLRPGDRYRHKAVFTFSVTGDDA